MLNKTDLPPPPNDVLACWRWYDKMAAGEIPKSYQDFDRKLELLKALFSNRAYELKWRHALRAQLGAMWEGFRYPQPTIKKPGRGRPAHFEGDFTFHLCVLDTILLKMLGTELERRKRSKRWHVMTRLLQEFFPKQCREQDGWTPDRAKVRVYRYLQKHAGGHKKVAALVEARSESMERLVDCIDAHLRTLRQQPPAQTPPSKIDLGIDGLALE